MFRGSRIIRNPLRGVLVLTFLNGVLVASLFYLKMRANYEEDLFAQLKQRVDVMVGGNASQEAVVIGATHITHHLLEGRFELFSGGQGWLLEPSAIDMMTGRGACGTYSKILARLLRCYDYPVRIGQMKARGRFGAHIIVEVRIGDRWVVTDPLYDLVFRRPDSSLASYTDLHERWSMFAAQTPPGYDSSYRYEDMRYTNWHKIPILMPALHHVLLLFLGERRTAAICLRMYLLKVYDLGFYIVLSAFVLLNGSLYRRFRKYRRRTGSRRMALRPVHETIEGRGHVAQ